MPFRNPSARVVIDGKPLVDDHFSGVGHYAMGLYQAVDELLEERTDLDVRLAVPVKRIGRLGPYRFQRMRPLAIPTPMNVMRKAMVADRLPPMDVVLGPGTYVFPDFVRWPLRGSRSITAIHDLCFEKVPEMVDDDNGRFLRREVAKAAVRSDRVTALTNTMADEIAEQYSIDRQKVVVVGCAADGARFYRRSDREISEVTRRHGIFGPYLLAVGNIEPRKNQARLVEAFASLPDDLADRFTLVLVGAGSWKDGEVRAAADLALAAGRKVRVLAGSVADAAVPALYSGATASAYVSVYEGFGMPPLESMASRTPVVASNASVIPEVVGDAAILVDPHSVPSIAVGLERALRLEGAEHEAVVAAGLANVARYDWADHAATLLDTIDQVRGEAR